MIVGKFHLIVGKLWPEENFTWSSENYDRRASISGTDVSRTKKRANKKTGRTKKQRFLPVSDPLFLAHPGKNTPFGRTPHSDVSYWKSPRPKIKVDNQTKKKTKQWMLGLEVWNYVMDSLLFCWQILGVWGLHGNFCPRRCWFSNSFAPGGRFLARKGA